MVAAAGAGELDSLQCLAQLNPALVRNHRLTLAAATNWWGEVLEWLWEGLPLGQGCMHLSSTAGGC